MQTKDINSCDTWSAYELEKSSCVNICSFPFCKNDIFMKKSSQSFKHTICKAICVKRGIFPKKLCHDLFLGVQGLASDTTYNFASYDNGILFMVVAIRCFV